MALGEQYLKFRCSQCGRCCKEPLLPLTDQDVRQLMERTGDPCKELVLWASSRDIALDEPDWYVTLRQGRRVMVLRHQRGACRYLRREGGCGAYRHRPLGCRVFPFDPTFDARGRLKRLDLIQAASCPRAMNGENDPASLRQLYQQYESAIEAYLERVTEWNRRQRQRRRQGKAAETGPAFLGYLGLLSPRRGLSRPSADGATVRAPAARRRHRP